MSASPSPYGDLSVPERPHIELLVAAGFSHVNTGGEVSRPLREYFSTRITVEGALLRSVLDLAASERAEADGESYARLDRGPGSISFQYLGPTSYHAQLKAEMEADGLDARPDCAFYASRSAIGGQVLPSRGEHLRLQGHLVSGCAEVTEADRGLRTVRKSRLFELDRVLLAGLLLRDASLTRRCFVLLLEHWPQRAEEVLRHGVAWHNGTRWEWERSWLRMLTPDALAGALCHRRPELRAAAVGCLDRLRRQSASVLPAPREHG